MTEGNPRGDEYPRPQEISTGTSYGNGRMYVLVQLDYPNGSPESTKFAVNLSSYHQFIKTLLEAGREAAGRVYKESMAIADNPQSTKDQLKQASENMKEAIAYIMSL